MSELPANPVAPPPAPEAARGTTTGAPPLHAPANGRWIAAGAVVLTALSAAALGFAWNTQQRLKVLEGELVKRQQDSGVQAGEARVLARQASDTAREVAAKMALLEARVSETTMQRSQFEDLIQSMARSRDENVLADVEASIRVAQQQSAITGSADPLVAALKQADERLARYGQPRLERVRRAVAQDLDRARAAGATEIPVLSIRLDELVRLVDELPLLSAVERRPGTRGSATQPSPARPASTAAAAAESSADEGLAAAAARRWNEFSGRVWDEVRTLIRVTRIDAPEAMLLAPEQAFFLRENLKLRLMNARLALLSRQFDIAQSDLRDAQAALERYFDRGSRRVAAATEQVRQVAAQARLVTVPRPDATLAAITAAAAGR